MSSENARTTPIAEAVRQYLDNVKWKYDITVHEGLMVYNARVNLPNGEFRVDFDADDGRERFGVYCFSAIYIPEDKRMAVAEYLMRVNYRLQQGKIEMDLNDGEIRSVATSILEDSHLSQAMIKSIETAARFNLNDAYPCLMSIAFGNASALEAFELYESLYTLVNETSDVEIVTMSEAIENGKSELIPAAFIGYQPYEDQRPMVSVVEQYLSDMGWDYEIVKEESNRLVLTTTVIVGYSACRTFFDIKDNKSLLGISTYLPIKVPVEKIGEVVAFLTRLNCNLYMSRIDVNLTSGKIRSVCRVTTKDSQLSYAMMSYMRCDVHKVTETCLPGILSIIYGKVSAEDAWRAVRVMDMNYDDAVVRIYTNKSVDQDNSKE